MTLLVGTAQASYYEQAAAANLKVPMGSSVNVGQGYEHKRFTPPSLANMYVTTNYIEEVDTPASKAFVAEWHAKYPNEPYINQEAENSYHAIYLYKQMVERAGSTDREKIRERDRQGRRLRRCAGGQGLHRSEEPARLPTRSSGRSRADQLHQVPRCGTTSSRTGWAKPAAT